MKVELIHNTPLWVAAKAIRKCWASEGKSDTVINGWEDDCGAVHDYSITIGTKDKELIERVGNKNKHKSTLEHLVYTFDVDGISRACLQEVARHRIASYSVKSTRYTLKELKDEPTFYMKPHSERKVPPIREERVNKYLVETGNADVDVLSVVSLEILRTALIDGNSNDYSKYCLPEAYKTSLVMTINARSLQNFLELRTNKSALWEIQNLAKALYDALPEEHKYLFKNSLNYD